MTAVEAPQDVAPPRTTRRWLPTMAAAFIAIGAVLLIALPEGFSARTVDPDGHGYYQRLADGFEHGQLSIRERPPGWLVRADNPYDPAVNAPVQRYGITDASLADGKYYYYWGPAPVVAFVMPLRLIGIDVTETDLGIAAAVAIVVLTCLLVKAIADRWRMSSVLEFATALGLSFGFSAFHLLRSVLIWEATVLIAAAFGMGAIYCFVRVATIGVATQRAEFGWWLAGGVSLALALGTRFTYGIYLLFPIALLLIDFRRCRPRDAPALARNLAAAAGPALLLAAALAVYNILRFGSPFDVGQTTTLNAGYDQSKIVLSSLTYTWPNAYYYSVRPFSLTPYFPFIAFDRFHWPFGTHLAYDTNQPVAGVAFTSPLLLLGVSATVFAGFVRRLRRDPRFECAAAWLGVAILQLFVLSTIIYAASERYRVEMDVTLVAVSALGVSLVSSWVRSRSWTNVIIAVVSVAALVSASLSIASAYHGLIPFHPAQNWFGDRLEALTSPVRRAALRSGPFVLVSPLADDTYPVRLNGPFLVSPTSTIRVYSGRSCAIEVTLERLDADTGNVTVTSGPGASVRADDNRIKVIVEPGPVERVVPVGVTRGDGTFFTQIERARSRYRC